jgi:uridine phosphorylase
LPRIQPFTRASKGDVSTHVLVTSLEEVYEEAVSKLHDVTERTGRYGFKIASGTLHRAMLSVALRPVGPSALAILVEELARLGAKVVLNLDTGLALSPSLSIGDIVLATAAIKGDGVSKAYAPIEVPAIPDYSFLRHIQQSLEIHNVKAVAGVVWSMDMFYMTEQVLEEGVRRYGKIAIALDMDTASLFTVSMSRRLLSASVIVIESSLPKGVERGSLFLPEEAEELRRKVLESISRVIQPILEALTLHIEKMKSSHLGRNYTGNNRGARLSGG